MCYLVKLQSSILFVTYLERCHRILRCLASEGSLPDSFCLTKQWTPFRKRYSSCVQIKFCGGVVRQMACQLHLPYIFVQLTPSYNGKSIVLFLCLVLSLFVISTCHLPLSCCPAQLKLLRCVLSMECLCMCSIRWVCIPRRWQTSLKSGGQNSNSCLGLNELHLELHICWSIHWQGL